MGEKRSSRYFPLMLRWKSSLPAQDDPTYRVNVMATEKRNVEGNHKSSPWPSRRRQRDNESANYVLCDGHCIILHQIPVGQRGGGRRTKTQQTAPHDSIYFKANVRPVFILRDRWMMAIDACHVIYETGITRQCFKWNPELAGSGRAHSGRTAVFPASISSGFLACLCYLSSSLYTWTIPRLLSLKICRSSFCTSCCVARPKKKKRRAGSDFPQQELLCVIYACCVSANRGPGLFPLRACCSEKGKCQKPNEKRERKINHALFTVQTDWVSGDHVIKDNFLFVLFFLTKH